MLPYELSSTCMSRGLTLQFWRVDHTIGWEDNIARQNRLSAQEHWGSRCQREHLLALLPEEPRERVEKPEQTRPAEPELLEPKAVAAPGRYVEKYPKQQNERPTSDDPHDCRL